MSMAYEVNFDGLAGPTHNYGGLAFGNLASMASIDKPSNPKAAALQGLHKMRLLHQLGIKQALLPPQERPNIQLLRALGFIGNDNDILKNALSLAPEIFAACYSSSSMWTANAATVSPSIDSQDKRLHFTVSNLQNYLHRAQEAEFTFEVFKKIFANETYFAVHAPLLATTSLADEGAANHNRFCYEYGSEGVQMFVYGKEGLTKDKFHSTRYPARQTRLSQAAIARLHQLNPNNTLFIQQNPTVIDAGVFHNDVISVVNQNVFLYHEEAFVNTEDVVEQIKQHVDFPISLIRIEKSDISVSKAVESYLFNSQIVTLASGDMVLLAPKESEESKEAFRVLIKVKEDSNPINRIEFVDCQQSMQNGGGPACLRLRVVMTETELAHCHAGVFLTDSLLQQLTTWVEKHYRDRLIKQDLLDPKFLQESRQALDELTTLLKIGSIYPFQKI